MIQEQQCTWWAKRIKLRRDSLIERSRTTSVVLTANWEVHTHEEAQVFVHDSNLVVPCNYSRKRLESYRWASFAKTTDTPMSGSAVKSHDWPKTGRLSSARRITSYLLSFQGYPPILEAVRLQHLYHRTRWEERQNKHPGNWCNLLQVHLQVQY